jgi:hypothetical protein
LEHKVYELIDAEYEWIKGWQGPPGAAYNQIYEFLHEGGVIDRAGKLTPRGHEAVQHYEMKKWNI